MAYDGDGNRIFQLNYNLHTDDDWKGNSGNGNGNNKDNTGSGNKGNGNGNKKGAVAAIAEFFTGEEPEAGKLGAGVSQALAEHLFSEEILGGLAEGLGIPEETVTAQEEAGTDSSDTANADGQTMTATPSNAAPGAVSPGNAAASYAGKNDNGNNGNGGNGNHYGWGNGNNGNGNGNNGNGNGNSSTGGTNDNNGNASGNTNNTGGSQNQSGILFPVADEVSELEQELIDMIKTTGKQKNYELVEYVNDVNRDHVEVLMELNINGIMDTAYSYGNERLINERFTGWTGYYTYDPRGSVTGVTGSDGYIWRSYRYNAFGDITFGKPQYNNVYSYNAESFNPNIDAQYLRSRYYSVKTAGFISEDSYLGNITDPLTLNRYNYVKSSPLNYVDPSGNWPETESHIVRTDHVPVADWSNATRTSHAPERPSLDDWLSEMAVKLAVSSKKRQMERELEKNMKAAQAASQSTGCFEAVVVADSVLSFLLSMTLGAVGAVIENGTALVRQPKNFVQDVTGQARDKTMLDLMRDISTNSLGFEIGRLIGDLASIMIGYHTTLLGLGTLVASGATGQIQVTPAGIVIVAEGVAITISGALDTADALGAVEVELSKAASPGGSRLGNEDEGDSNSDHMVGENGTQTSSKTTWQNGKTERIDVENPAPGERPGQIHYHDSNNNKWYYDIENNTFYDQKTGDLAPKSVQKLLNDNNFMKGIKKALGILGE